MDSFFSKKFCDRCGKDLKDGFTMSMFNEDCICLECKKKERENPRYKQACEVELQEVKRGNYNFKGIGL